MQPAPGIQSALRRETLTPASPDYVLFIIVMCLAGIGLAMVFSSSAIPSFLRFGNMHYFLKKQAVWLGISLVGMLVMLVIDYRLLKRAALAMIIVALGLLILVFVPGLGTMRWLELGPIRFQPSEFAKLALILFVAGVSARHKTRLREFRMLALVMGFCGFMCFLVLLEPDMGGVLIIGATCVAMLFAAGARKLHMAALFLAAAPALIMVAVRTPYMLRRLTSFVDPWADPFGAGFNIIQSQVSFASGGFLGRGLTDGYQKLFYLPAQHTDFIFSVIGEELGFLGAMAVVALFVLFAVRGFRIARTTIDPFAKHVAFGITFSITFQAMLNMGVATGLAPVTGLTLPFVSYGGSSLVATFMFVGLLLNISGRAPVAEAIYSNEIPAGGRRNRWAHLPGDSYSPAVDGTGFRSRL